MMGLRRKSGLISITAVVILLGCFSVRAIAGELVRIMPLGDSITWGVGSAGYYYNGYRKPLYLELTAAGYNFDFVGGQVDGDFSDPHHEGHGGWHAAGGPNGKNLLPNVYNWLTANPADIVLLHIGTNDITYGGQDANEVNDILDEIDRFSIDTKVILALIIDRKDHNQATTQFNIDVNNMAQNRIAAGDDIIIVDMEQALNYATDMYDYLHPNDAGYAKMADVWFNALDSVLAVPPTIVSAPVRDGIVTQTYIYDVDADGYPNPNYTLVTRPDGMTIDHNTGLIEWLPVVAGDFNVTVEASNGQMPDANQSFVVTVDRIITFDAASSNSSSSDGNVLSWQHTIGGGYKRILVVGIAGEDDNENDLVINSVEYNDVSMALVEGSSKTVSSGGYYMKTELYYLLDANLPSLPGDYNITVTYNGNVGKRCGGAISLTNVEQQVREAVATNSNVGQNTISTNITTQTNNAWVVDVVGCGNAGSFLTNSDGMTERFDVNSDGSSAAGSTKPVESAQETTMSWTHSGANQLAHSVTAFAPVSRIIAGCVSEPNGVPIGGVSVLVDANDVNIVTDPNGYYRVLVPPHWSGAVMPKKDGHLFSPSERTYSQVITDLLDQHYEDISIYDLDDDGLIGWGDVSVMADNWLLASPEKGDLVVDGIVNFLDFADFALVWQADE